MTQANTATAEVSSPDQTEPASSVLEHAEPAPIDPQEQERSDANPWEEYVKTLRALPGAIRRTKDAARPLGAALNLSGEQVLRDLHVILDCQDAHKLREQATRALAAYQKEIQAGDGRGTYSQQGQVGRAERQVRDADMKLRTLKAQRGKLFHQDDNGVPRLLGTEQVPSVPVEPPDQRPNLLKQADAIIRQIQSQERQSKAKAWAQYVAIIARHARAERPQDTDAADLVELMTTLDLSLEQIEADFEVVRAHDRLDDICRELEQVPDWHSELRRDVSVEHGQAIARLEKWKLRRPDLFEAGDGDLPRLLSSDASESAAKTKR